MSVLEASVFNKVADKLFKAVQKEFKLEARELEYVPSAGWLDWMNDTVQVEIDGVRYNISIDEVQEQEDEDE